ncbi:hypothetical protein A2526_01050 [candidate division WOR-1 bacterium RIFOXYD2_FULL_36_8]|nr:MAG: hypothetical protein A2526_01050 [candidate division WOR-1 bacterium RIFOXYD2_FULL_36_8]
MFGEIPPQLTAYFRKTNLSSLTDRDWQVAVDLRVGLKDARDKKECQRLERMFQMFYQRSK